ncbi:hypothetical protein Q8A73_012912 [Channa argus]|nr:hypothetical protein Q8A73_012912 [Channa argus]
MRNEPYSVDLTNRNNRQFRDLEQRVVGLCNEIYRRKFGNKFGHCFVEAFRSAATQVDGTEADIGVVFNETIPITDLPMNAVVVQTFVLSVNDSSNNFPVGINANTVKLISSPVTDPNTSITATTTTAASTSTVTTTAATSTTAPLTEIMVTFRSLLVTFTSDLNDPSSQRFIQRSANITSQIKPRCQNAFPSSFKDLKVVGFRKGSIINTLNLTFDSRSVPNRTQIASVFINAAPYVTGFDIEGISITLQVE